jgi:hypothetical protein
VHGFTSKLDREIAELRLRRVGKALQQWRQQHGDQLPAGLAELVPLLPTDDAEPLLVPGDAQAGKLVGRDGHGAERSFSCSFAMAPAGMVVQATSEDANAPVAVWLYEANGGTQGLILGPDGSVRQVPADALAAALAQKR